MAADPAHPARTIAVDPQSISGAVEVFAGTLNPGPPISVTDFHADTVVYGGQDGHLYQVSALTSNGPPAATQLSNEAGAGLICRSTSDGFDLTDPALSQFVYELPGPNGTCSDNITQDNVWRMVTVGMNASDSPVPAKKPVAALHDWSTTGALIGWLALDGATVYRYDPQFTDATKQLVITITSAVSRVDASTEMPADGIFLVVDNTLRFYNVGTGTLSESLYSNVPFGIGAIAIIRDGVNGFFQDGSSIYKVPADGSAPATLLVSDHLGPVFALLDYSVVYTVLTGTGTELHSVLKSGMLSFKLDSVPDEITGLWTAGFRVYYNVLSASGVTAKVMHEDGTPESSSVNSAWVGMSNSTTLSYGTRTTPMRLILSKKMHGASVAKSTLSSIDAATNTPVAKLGSVPSDIDHLGFFGSGNELLAVGWSGFLLPPDIAVISAADVFFLDSETTNSFARVSSTPDIESLIQTQFPAFSLYATF